MRLTMLVFAMLVVGCGPSLEGNWIFSDNTEALAFDIVDGGYAISELLQTTSGAFDAIVEVGTITSTGTTLSLTPRELSCRQPDPPYSLNYQFNGSDLVVDFSFGIVAFAPNIASASSSGSGGSGLVFGCIIDGGFVEEPLGPPEN